MCVPHSYIPLVSSDPDCEDTDVLFGMSTGKHVMCQNILYVCLYTVLGLVIHHILSHEKMLHLFGGPWKILYKCVREIGIWLQVRCKLCLLADKPCDEEREAGEDSRKKSVSAFGSITAYLSDGMTLALSQFGADGKAEDGEQIASDHLKL